MKIRNGKQGGNICHSLEKLAYVEDLAAYIEEHLDRELSAEMLAQRYYVSKGKLYRDFLNATGHPIREYIRKRRLSNALALLKSSTLTCGAVACECGYSSKQAMCRSIQAFLGMSAGEYRQAENYYFFPSYQGGAVFDIYVRPLTVPALYGFRFYQRSLQGIEDGALALLFEKVPDFSGRLFGRNGQQKGSFFCYELYVTEEKVYRKLLEISREEGQEAASFSRKNTASRNLCFSSWNKREKRAGGWFEKGADLPEQTGLFATVRVKNQENSINEAWDYLCKSWLSNSMYEQDGNDYLEEYNQHALTVKSLKLMLPLRVAETYPKISIEKMGKQSFLAAEGTGLNAEWKACKVLGRYLAGCQIEQLKNTKEFYVREDTTYDRRTKNHCERIFCGVRADGINWEKAKEDGISLKTYKEGYYIVLRGNCFVEPLLYQKTAEAFAAQNRLSLAGEDMFVIVCMEDGFQNPRMAFYGKIVFRDSEQNDNTAGESCVKIRQQQRDGAESAD